MLVDILLSRHHKVKMYIYLTHLNIIFFTLIKINYGSVMSVKIHRKNVC